MKQIVTLYFLTAFLITVKAQNNVNMEINKNATVKQVKEIQINASPEKIWEVLTGINEWKNWNSDITKSMIYETPKVGSEFTWKVNGAKIKSQLHTVNQFTSLGWTGKALGAKAIHNWYLQPINNGTLIRVEESMEGWLVNLFKKKMNADLEKGMVDWLEALKIECEK